jgi:hypothetical protein
MKTKKKDRAEGVVVLVIIPPVFHTRWNVVPVGGFVIIYV